ncbi:MAG: hypothetical protein NBV67_02045 [Tagaea sp.]|nr:hypothetical protein [Tagaea sp.]
MIQKILKARGIGDMLRYLLGSVDSSGRRRPRAEIIDSVFAGRNEWELTREISAIVARRPTVKRNMFHSTLRLSPKDRHVSDQEWSRLCRRYIGELGFDTFLVVSHGDHVHILCPRIRLDGSVVPDGHDFARGEKIVRLIEIDFELQRVRPSHLLEPEASREHVRAPTAAAIQKLERFGEQSDVMLVQEAILEILGEDNEVWIDDFECALAKKHIRVIKRRSRVDVLPQLAFVYADRTFGPRALGGKFTARNLLSAGLNFESRPVADPTKAVFEPDEDKETLPLLSDEAQPGVDPNSDGEGSAVLSPSPF